MKIIYLSKGLQTKVDDESYFLFCHLNWIASKSNHGFYAQAKIQTKACRKTFALHRLVMNEPVKMFVDHRDRDTLNNLKDNLRICTQCQNNLNRPGRHKATSRYKGVSWSSCKNKWAAEIGHQGKNYALGRYKTEEEAAMAYNAAAIKFHGEFAYLNQLK